MDFQTYRNTSIRCFLHSSEWIIVRVVKRDRESGTDNTIIHMYSKIYFEDITFM